MGESRKYARALHLFRRDLRLDDNTALAAASKESREVRCCFILDPRQVGDQPYRGDACVQFMIESLRELSQEIDERGGTLAIHYGTAEVVLEQIIKSEGIEAVYFNRDYTPFSRNRDRALHEVCVRNGVAAHQFADALLHEPEDVKKSDGTPYTVYTPFMKRASQLPVRAPLPFVGKNLSRWAGAAESEQLFSQVLVDSNPRAFARGGRRAAVAVLDRISDFKSYAETRDLPALQATTGLAAHHKFGTISARETYQRVARALGPEHTLNRELWWRDFFTHIGFHFPHVFRGAFHQRYDRLAWENNEDWFQRWCDGQTGFPLVDAGMRQLNATGFMHNRVRMVVASFLTKDLLIDWRWGERYFATKLVDYDPAVNNGNWQWAASTGCDAQPYFRVFNPWLQQERFDPECQYVKRWVPELADVKPKLLHQAGDVPLLGVQYPSPLVDHAEQKSKAVKMFSAVRD